MKVSSLLLVAATCVCGSSAAFGFAEFARGEVVLATTARVEYDSRVFGGQAGGDDYIFTLDPRLIYRREAGLLKMDSFVGTRINRYRTYDDLNSEDLLAALTLRLPKEAGARFSGDFSAGYDERTEVNYDVNARLREKTFQTRLNSVVPISLKTSLLLGGAFRRDQRNAYSDHESREGTIGFRYQDFLGGSALDLRYRRLETESTGENALSIPLDQQSDTFSATLSRPIYHEVRGSVTYGYRVLNRSRAEVLDPTQDTEDAGSIFGVQINGPFLPRTLFPKLDSSVSFGYQKTETPGINDKGGSRFHGNLQVGWHVRERSLLYVKARRSIELSINDLTVETTAFSAGLEQTIGNFTSARILVGYEERTYDALIRQDDILLFEAGLRYRITKRWAAGADYRVRSTESTTPVAEFDRHVIAASATYTF